jgi:molybdopterin-biosynthesis enzyme MoeA-like protein
MSIGLIIIGDEILSGRRQDKHLAHAIDALAARGLELAWVRYSGDDDRLLSQQFREINAAGDICFSFGGIGATHDDRTRQAVAMALEQALKPHPDAIREIEARFGEEAYPNRILMADLPETARIIPNPYNRIPGFSVNHIHCLPGFPEMAWPMMEWVLDTLYPNLKAEQPIQKLLTLENAHESTLVQLMSDFQDRHPTVKLSSLPRFLPDNRRELELGLRGQKTDTETALVELKALLSEHQYAFTETA